MFNKVYLGDTLISKIMLGDTNIKYREEVSPPNEGNYRLFAVKDANFYEIDPINMTIIKQTTNEPLNNKAKYLVGGIDKGELGLYWLHNNYDYVSTDMITGAFNPNDFSIIFEADSSASSFKPPKHVVCGGGVDVNNQVKIYYEIAIFNTLYELPDVRKYTGVYSIELGINPITVECNIAYFKENDTEYIWCANELLDITNNIRVKRISGQSMAYSAMQDGTYYIYELEGVILRKMNAQRTEILETMELPLEFDSIVWLKE